MSENSKSNSNEKPGDGIRSMRSSTAFRVVNFELYAKPNIVIMSIGLTCFGLALGYIAYMRHKYESMGYYSAINEEGKETFEKKKSKWE
ncbi:small integral membrane protein 8 [Vanessa tameamea]|uniref:Small integral membrane protein 8 n=1 Tax=Vanessa tameamea TaxID=334116 RepID=A0A8B8HHK0_VANTA|nr:small integral membrane protein 8 [Vanessa tameamea]XP_047539570.1 small integral membrane protein 8 [Vanessa atalanta]XP_047539577.1 small integral membrane protein 8 [Vanessa atalanta]XP_047539585.1 small integral membrane protein 8 [Vanessa atalanta]